MKVSTFICTGLACLIFLCSSPAWSKNDGGFSGPTTSQSTTIAPARHNGSGVGVLTVEQAKNMADDSLVTLRGTLESRLDSEHYMFKDNTGTIRVEIDAKLWKGQNVSPSDLVEIEGEVEKDKDSIEIDVKRIVKLSQPK